MLAQTNGGSWKPIGDSYVFQDTGYKVVRSTQPTRCLGDEHRLADCPGDSTCMSFASFRIDAFDIRMQPWETYPGRIRGSFVSWIPTKPARSVGHDGRARAAAERDRP